MGPDGITWKCAVCDSVNPLDLKHCSVCGAALAATLREPEPQPIARDPGKVTLLSLLLPGAGHAYLGLWGQAIARAVTSIWVLFVLLATGVQQGLSAPMPIFFALASFALWAATAHDAFREAVGDPRSVLLRGRTFLYVVMGLIALSVVMVFVTALGARPS